LPGLGPLVGGGSILVGRSINKPTNNLIQKLGIDRQEEINEDQ